MSRAINTITAATAADGAANLNIDSGTLFIDTTNNNVGIGTTGPSTKLDVLCSPNAGIRVTDGTQVGIMYASGVGGIVAGTTSTHPYILYSNNTERLRIDSSGRVGIGMTPAALLDISKSDNTGSVTDFPALRVTNTNSTQGNGTSTYNYARIDVKSGNGTVFGDFGTRYDSLYSGAYIGTESSHPVLFQTGGYERLRIDSSGRVGIGTASPTSRLAVSFDQSSNNQFINIVGTQSSYSAEWGFSIPTNTKDFRIYDYVANIERLRITSGGEVCVGRTSSGAKLHIYNSGSTDARTAYFEKATGTTDGYYLVCYAGITTHFQMLGNGNCQNANNSYAGISDIRLKQDITDAPSQWSDIKNLRVRKYRFKEYPEMPLQIGVVAQEVELVSPQLVEETKDTDREGNDLGTITKGVKYSVLYMKAVKALQEAMDRIEQLESKVAALEAA